MTDLCCFWTGSNTLPPRHQDIKLLLLKFDDGASDLPLSETCFLTMTIPSKYKTYDEFKKHMDIDLYFKINGKSYRYTLLLLIFCFFITFLVEELLLVYGHLSTKHLSIFIRFFT